MRPAITRRNFIRTTALTAATVASAKDLLELTKAPQTPSEKTPIRLGLASYTLRNFTPAQMIADMQQLKISALNAKDVKDHLPTNPQEEQAALADYAAA